MQMSNRKYYKRRKEWKEVNRKSAKCSLTSKERGIEAVASVS